MKQVIRWCAWTLLLSVVSGGAAWAEGDEALGPPFIPIDSGTGVATAGVGLVEDVGVFKPGDIVIDVPGDVVQAILYWAGRNRGTDAALETTLIVNGTDVTGPRIGFSVFDTSGDQAAAYRQDITGMVSPGMNTLSITGTLFADFFTYGAGLVVIYDDGSGTSTIRIDDGLDSAYGPAFALDEQVAIPVEILFEASSVARVSEISMFVTEVGDFFDSDRFRNNEIQVSLFEGADLVDLISFVDELQSLDGPVWDTLTRAITIPAGVDTMEIELISNGADPASMEWIASAVSVPFRDPSCGDGIIDDGAGETCEPPGEPAGEPNECRDDCTFCGDGRPDPGEECDDGNNLPGDGCTPICELCSGIIGDFVWNDGVVDLDCDGIQPDDGTSGINGVSVCLEDADGNPLGCTTTAPGPDGEDGYYEFDELCLGDYEIVVDDPAGFTRAPSGVVDPAVDSNGSPAMVSLASDMAMDQTIDFGFCSEGADNNGCPPRYWKRRQGSWDATAYSPHQLVGSVFSEANGYRTGAAPLVRALQFKGGPKVRGAMRILLRVAVAAVLNASHPDVNYLLSEGEVITQVNAALASGDRGTMLDLAWQLKTLNNNGCPLRRPHC